MVVEAIKPYLTVTNETSTAASELRPAFNLAFADLVTSM